MRALRSPLVCTGHKAGCFKSSNQAFVRGLGSHFQEFGGSGCFRLAFLQSRASDQMNILHRLPAGSGACLGTTGRSLPVPVSPGTCLHKRALSERRKLNAVLI